MTFSVPMLLVITIILRVVSSGANDDQKDRESSEHEIKGNARAELLDDTPKGGQAKTVKADLHQPGPNPTGLLFLAFGSLVICGLLFCFRKPFPKEYPQKKDDELPCALDKRNAYY
jgi:hypothetical protein